jgi:uncharacterized protein YjcR
VNYSQKDYEEMKLKIKISRNWDDDYIHEVVETALEKGRPICGVKTRAGTPCKKSPAVNGRCRISKHNGSPSKMKGNQNAKGNSGGSAPEKNKNAVTTGEYETIWLDCLSEKEQKKYNSIDTDLSVQIDEEIKLTTFREYKMMKRIADLAEVDYTTVQKVVKSKPSKDKQIPSVVVSEQEEKVLATLSQIQGIEDALTRVQGRKARLLSLKHKIQNNEMPTDTIEIEVTLED